MRSLGFLKHILPALIGRKGVSLLPVFFTLFGPGGLPSGLGVATVNAAPEVYVVVPGDTLSDIAGRYGLGVSTLAQINNLRNPNFLLPGQALIISGGQNPSERTTPEATGPEVRMSVPYRTQFDGTRYEESNCGPATLGMLMSYFGQRPSTDDLRRSVNTSLGYWGLDGGSDWESLVHAAEIRGFRAQGLYQGPKKYRKWTIDELVQEVQQGRPVMLLVRYRSLPGHEYESWWGDHYIVFLGLSSIGDVVYHDSAFKNPSKGAYKTMSQPRLLRAWGGTSVGINYSAMALQGPVR